MEITIKINGRMVSVEVNDEVAECYDQGRRKAENLYHEIAGAVFALCAVWFRLYGDWNDAGLFQGIRL